MRTLNRFDRVKISKGNNDVYWITYIPLNGEGNYTLVPEKWLIKNLTDVALTIGIPEWLSLHEPHPFADIAPSYLLKVGSVDFSDLARKIRGKR